MSYRATIRFQKSEALWLETQAGRRGIPMAEIVREAVRNQAAGARAERAILDRLNELEQRLDVMREAVISASKEDTDKLAAFISQKIGAR